MYYMRWRFRLPIGANYSQLSSSSDESGNNVQPLLITERVPHVGPFQ